VAAGHRGLIAYLDDLEAAPGWRSHDNGENICGTGSKHHATRRHLIDLSEGCEPKKEKHIVSFLVLA
jgi:hypothetical protein